MLLREYVQTKHGISRRKFTDLVDNGFVSLNWEIVTSYKALIEDNDGLVIENKEFKIKDKIKLNEKVKPVIVLFNKPKWYVVSKADPFNKTIYEVLPKEFNKYYYIWRLDKDSHGLLLLTNDPWLVNEYEHPKFEIEKEYVVKIDRVLAQNDIEKMKKWILDEGELLSVKRISKSPKDGKILNFLLLEWKNRHIRRILMALWYRVMDLQRIREGKFDLANLKVGEWKII